MAKNSEAQEIAFGFSILCKRIVGNDSSPGYFSAFQDTFPIKTQNSCNTVFALQLFFVLQFLFLIPFLNAFEISVSEQLLHLLLLVDPRLSTEILICFAVRQQSFRSVKERFVHRLRLAKAVCNRKVLILPLTNQ